MAAAAWPCSGRATSSKEVMRLRRLFMGERVTLFEVRRSLYLFSVQSCAVMPFIKTIASIKLIVLIYEFSGRRL
jgi:hypothetical protein